MSPLVLIVYFVQPSRGTEAGGLFWEELCYLWAGSRPRGAPEGLAWGRGGEDVEREIWGGRVIAYLAKGIKSHLWN